MFHTRGLPRRQLAEGGKSEEISRSMEPRVIFLTSMPPNTVNLAGITCRPHVLNLLDPRWHRRTIGIFHKQCCRNYSEKEFPSKLQLRDKLDQFYKRLAIVNQHYEHITGIAAIRQIQDEVMTAESEFATIREARRSCQDRIDALKDRLKGLKKELESIPRSSESYLNILTTEHQLAREQESLDQQLTKHKEREQLSFDNLSKLLRRSHELERIRQERSRYWQIISVSLSVAGGLIALIAQKERNQNFFTKKLDSIGLEIEQLRESQIIHTNQIEKVRLIVEKLVHEMDSRKNARERTNSIIENQSSYRWITYLPGLSSLNSWLRYFF